MSNQNNPVDYVKAIQYQLADIVDPIPVYANFNRNFAKQTKFITWQLRNIHQPVYTGSVQSVKGIDRPTFQISIFAQSMHDAFNMSDDILQSLHGYSGQFGGVNGFFIAKADVFWLYNSYDDELKLHQIFLDCTIDVPA